MNPWELLLRRLLAARTWPLGSERAVRQRIATWAALRESHEPTIRRLMGWPRDRQLVIDNLPEKIAGAYGDLLHSGELRYTAADPADQERGEAMTRTWAAELPSAEETCASEGEVWWRFSVNPALPHPTLTWHSRWDVVPLLHGRNVLAAAFISRLPTPGGRKNEVWRHIELHGQGVLLNLLFRGREEALGQQLDLERHMETAGLPERWDTDLPLLCGRIVHRWGRRPDHGVSIYNGVWSRFLSINEAVTIGRENMRLTAKKRITVPPHAVRRPTGALPEGKFEAGADQGDGTIERRPVAAFDAGEDVFVVDQLDVQEGGSGAGASPFKVLEYSFDSEALVRWTTFEVNTACQRCDIVPQFIGEGDFGSGLSGYSFRVRLLPTVNAAEGAGRPWDEQLPHMALLGQLLEARPAPYGGIGRSDWVAPASAPDIERSSELPEDPTEVAQRHATLKTADLISIETSLRERFKDRDEDWYAEEVDRIRADIGTTMPVVPPVTPPPPGDE